VGTTTPREISEQGQHTLVKRLEFGPGADEAKLSYALYGGVIPSQTSARNLPHLAQAPGGPPAAGQKPEEVTSINELFSQLELPPEAYGHALDKIFKEQRTLEGIGFKVEWHVKKGDNGPVLVEHLSRGGGSVDLDYPLFSLSLKNIKSVIDAANFGNEGKFWEVIEGILKDKDLKSRLQIKADLEGFARQMSGEPHDRLAKAAASIRSS
jgi:hypothetical protein